MLSFVPLRLVRILPIALGVVTIIFFIFKMIPGDEATLMAGASASQAEIDLLRVRLGLDRPILQQYLAHIFGILQGDLGFSSTFRGNPLPHIIGRLPATLALMTTSILTTVALGLPAGVIAAVYQNRWPDYALSAFVVALLAVPNFWLGMMLIVVLSVDWGWLPSFGFTGWLSLVMPTAALAARLIALVARMTRGVMLEELRKDYVRTARAKGLDGRTVVVRHVLRNALIPTVTVIGLQTGYLLGGSVVVERLFAWPGIGDLMINAIGARDYTLVQGITLLFVLGFLLINLAVEMLYVVINPRLRHA
ncbi:MAG: ABC transporter permease [Proteobacteria bacterium]|nr:ABC transporter permease [Pseudomonadota bacterium]MBI3496152.1 ABC transporter permease [Pseudomonadota bacterium]